MIGIFYGIGNVPHHVAFNCKCGDTRGIAWAKCTPEQRREAMLADMTPEEKEKLQARCGATISHIKNTA